MFIIKSTIAGCSAADDTDNDVTTDAEGTTDLTVEVNAETLAPKQQEQVSAVADSLTENSADFGFENK